MLLRRCFITDENNFNSENFGFENEEIGNLSSNPQNDNELNENVGDMTAEPYSSGSNSDKARKGISEIFEWLDVLVTAMVAVVLIFSFLFRIATIQGSSMVDTLHNKEKVVISNLGYNPKAGDIVVISRNQNNSVEDETSSELPIIKRVIATAGQEVDIRNGSVYIDGEKLDEPYLSDGVQTYAKQGQVEFPLYVPSGYIFVLGDNRGDSTDSRNLQIGEQGIINTDYILGRVIFRIIPFTTAGDLKK